MAIEETDSFDVSGADVDLQETDASAVEDRTDQARIEEAVEHVGHAIAAKPDSPKARLP